MSLFRASPRLKDAIIPAGSFFSLYTSLLLVIRRLFHACHLVHADLSEYNILYHADTLYIIDVSQAVEHDHPHAFDFLRSDIGNVEEFFGRRGVRTIGLRRAFEFVVREDGSLKDELSAAGTEEVSTGEVDIAKKVLEKWMTEEPQPSADDQLGDAEKDDSAAQLREHEDAIFKQSFIPRNLNQVYDPERDVDILARGGGSDLIYKESIGLVSTSSAAALEEGVEGETSGLEPKLSIPNPKVSFDIVSNKDDQSEDETSDSEETQDEDSADTSKDNLERSWRGHRHEDKETKKERKKAVKNEQQERRKAKKEKMDKKEKKRRVNATSSKRR